MIIVTQIKESFHQLKKNDFVIVIAILLFAAFVCFDFGDKEFSWMAFHERDFSKACDFLLGYGLNCQGPETVYPGVYVIGPWLTLLFSIVAFVYPSPEGVHILLQLSYLLSCGLTFYLVRRHFNRSVAYLTLLFMLSSSDYMMYSFAGWHASLVLPAGILIAFLYDLYYQTDRLIFLWSSCFVACASISFHFMILQFILFSLIMILVFIRKKFLPTLFSLIPIFFITYLYYFIQDAQNNFTNIKGFSVSDTVGNLMAYQVASSQVSRIIHLFVVTIRSYGANVFFSPASPVCLNHDYLGLCSPIAIFCAYLISLYKKDPDLKKFQKPLLFCLLLVLLPLFFRAGHARYYQQAHPAFEVLMAASVYLIFRRVSKKPILKFGVCIFVFLITFWSLWILSPFSSQKFIPKGDFHRPYTDSKLATEALIAAGIDPDTYENRFYAFMGHEHWLFRTKYTLPSNSHYRLRFNKFSEKVSSPNIPQDVGYIFVPKDEANEFNAASLDIINILNLKDVFLYVYKGPYYHHQTHEYSQWTLEEKEMTKRSTGDPVVRSSPKEIYADVVIEIPTLVKNIQYLNKLFLNQVSENTIEGYMEIISPYLRQSRYGPGRPYFIKDPGVTINFKNGTSRTIELLKNHFYSNMDKRIDAVPIYKKYGEISNVNNLGNCYVESPYGIAIKLEPFKTTDIASITFFAKGFGSTNIDEDSDEIVSETIVVNERN